MPHLPIADAHVHFWNLEQHRYPWLDPPAPSGPFGKTAKIRETYLLQNYRHDAARQNVTRMLHVEAGWDPRDPLGEMRWIQAVADAHGAPHGHMAHIDLAAPDAPALIARHAEFPLFRGVRDRLQQGDFTQSTATVSRIDDGAWRSGMAILDRLRLAFDLQAPTALAEKAHALALAFPNVRFIVTHAGYPPSPLERRAYCAWRDGLQTMASAPNVSIKLSGLMLGEKAWRPEHARRSAKHLVDAFGTDRVMVASNFPVDRLFATMDALFDHYREWLSERPEAEQRKMLHDNACRIYRLDE